MIANCHSQQGHWAPTVHLAPQKLFIYRAGKEVKRRRRHQGAQRGIQTQASFSGASVVRSANTGPRDAWEPLSLRGLGDVGNASEKCFPSEFTRLAHSVLVKSSGKPEFFLSCHSHSQSAGSLLPVGTRWVTAASSEQA